MKVIRTERLPIKMWLDEVEDGALAQAKNLANLPFVFKHIALMPDCHQGQRRPQAGRMALKRIYGRLSVWPSHMQRPERRCNMDRQRHATD